MIYIKKIVVEICVCTQCLMNGAMDIIEAVEGMQKLKTQLKKNAQIDIITDKRMGDGKHPDKSPLVRINGELIECADCQTVMSKIMQLTSSI